MRTKNISGARRKVQKPQASTCQGPTEHEQAHVTMRDRHNYGRPRKKPINWLEREKKITETLETAFRSSPEGHL